MCGSIGAPLVPLHGNGVREIHGYFSCVPKLKTRFASNSEKTVLFTTRCNAEDQIPGPVEFFSGLHRWSDSYFGPAMMKFDEQLPDCDARVEQVFDNTVFRAFDIHLQQIDLRMPQRLHDACQSANRNFDCGSRSVPINNGVRDMYRIRRRQQNADSIVIRNAVIMEDKVLGQRLLAQPLDRLWRGIKCVHAHAKLPDQFQFKGNVLANSKRIDHARGGQAIRANTPLCAFVSQPQFCAVDLSPLPEVSPAECADSSLEILVGIENHALRHGLRC